MRMKRCAVVFILSLLTGLAIPAVGSTGDPITVPLFAPATDVPALDTPAGTIPLAMNTAAFVPGAVKVGDRLRTEPAPGVVFTTLVSKVATDINGTLTWRGTVEGSDGGLFLLSVADGQALGSIELPGASAHYLIRYEPTAQIHLAENALATGWEELEDSPSPVPPITASARGEIQIASAAPTAATIIDVMVVYTTNALAWAGGTNGINSIIAQALQRGQLAMDNTAVPVTLRLVHSALVPYTQSGNSGTDLTRLTINGDGYMDEVHTWRTTYGADVVVLLEEISDTGGIGWLLETTNGEPAYAFSITRVQQASWTYTTVHEIGHNMGCHHRRDQATQPGPGLYSYSAGWHWIGTNGGLYASVMSYEDGGYTRVGYWSSPTNYYQGTATGTPTDDNARGIINIKDVIAAYRTALGTNTFSFRAFAMTNSVVLRWTDPVTCGLGSSTVLIRQRNDQYPTNSSNDGTLVYTGTNTLYIHTALTNNLPYFYTIWVSYDGENFIEPP